MLHYRLALVVAIGCGHSPDAEQQPAAASLVAVRKLGTQPLEGTFPTDAGIRDISMLGPDDAGFHGACVTLHAPGHPPELLGMCDGLAVIQDTTQGRRLEDARPRVQSMEEDLDGAKYITHTERIADGWIIERSVPDDNYIDDYWSVRPGAQRYVLRVHRTIAGTPWNCGLIAQTRAELAEGERLCLSIRAPR
jgi:hypothetical protein